VRISPRRLGEQLIARRVLSRHALEALAARAAREGVTLQQVLLDDGAVSERDLIAAMADELGLPFLDLRDVTIAPDLWGLLPEVLARAHLAVAVAHRPDGVLVAMVDPTDREAVASLAAAVGRSITPAAAVRADVQALVGHVYGPSGGPEASVGPVADGPTLDDLLRAAVARGASDLHLTVGASPVLRIRGALHRLEGHPPLSGSDTRRLVLGVMTTTQQERFLREGSLSVAHAISGTGRFRMSAFAQRDSVGAVLRMVPTEVPAPEELGLPEEVVAWAEERRGLVLVCGPHGSGVSTTLAALVDRVNASRPAHVLTIEDPIEFLLRHKAGIVNQREVGEDVPTVAAGLRSALRQDADVIAVSELPDRESIQLALTAAETGRLVLAALHTLDAVQTIERVVDVFPEAERDHVRVQLAATLRGIVVQQLLPALDGGVALATEVLLPIPGVVTAIREGDAVGLTKAMLGASSSGISTMDQSLSRLAHDEVIARQVAIDAALEPDEVRYLLGEPR